MRLFVALELDEMTRSGILEVVEELSSRHKNAKWVSAGSLHFTLKFLGEIEDSMLGEVITSTEKSVEGIKSFKLHVHGLGYFGSRRFAKVIWVGTHEGRGEMVRLASELESKLSSFRKDERSCASARDVAAHKLSQQAARPPSPHITVCRPKGETLKLIEDVEKEKSRDFGFMEAKSIKLKKSTLTPQGAVYEDVKEFIFG